MATALRTTADLRTLLRAVDLVYFDGTLPPLTIKWGRCTMAASRKRQFYFGFYRPDGATISIHPVHAWPWVPGHVLQWTVFHEALHSVIGLAHDAAFYGAEKRFLHYDLAVEWCRKNHDRILGADAPLRKDLK